MSFVHTIRFHRGKLPHWEVESGCYFVTVRLADSLPRAAVARLHEIHLALAIIEPRSAQFDELQRQCFRVVEEYLDAGAGACLLRDERCAGIIVDELQQISDIGVSVPHYSIMPNHWHAILAPADSYSTPLSAVMKRIKGRSAKRIRRTLGDAGSVWQREWFDRWIRDAAEFRKTVAYIQDNPVKARLAENWTDHPWTR